MSYFKIWYIDKTITGNTFEDWKNAPDDGVLIIYENFGNGTGRVSMGSDWYWMTPDLNVSHTCTSSDIVDEYLSHNAPQDAVLKKGKWTTGDAMQNAINEMTNESTKT